MVKRWHPGRADRLRLRRQRQNVGEKGAEDYQADPADRDPKQHIPGPAAPPGRRRENRRSALRNNIRLHQVRRVGVGQKRIGAHDPAPLIRGSTARYRRSTAKLSMTYVAAKKTTKPCTTTRSCWTIAPCRTGPIPGSANTTSTMMVPPSSCPMLSPATVISESDAGRNAWRTRTRASLIPRERAASI